MVLFLFPLFLSSFFSLLSLYVFLQNTGIFSTLRPTLWKLFSGANRLRQNHISSSLLNYRTLCMVESHKDWVDNKQTDHAHFLLASLQFDQIELDITRTEETITGAETAALRRILRSFCLRNPRVGYCQAMNFVAISLLRAARTGSLSEEDAFWLLAAVCEEIVRCLFGCLLVCLFVCLLACVIVVCLFVC